MHLVKKYGITALTLLFFATIFLLSIIPLRDFDIWFHLKSGEIILQKGIIHYDVFSNSAQGREWFPYEWLFQVTVYLIQQAFSFEAIKYFIAAVITFQIFILYLIFRKVFNLHPLYTLFTLFFFFASVLDFYNARPHVVAYTLLLINLYLIFLYYFHKKNWLWLSFPVTLIWANVHGSIFLDIAVFASYAGLAFIQYLQSKKKEWMVKAKVLALFTVITSILTVLPPLGFLQYRLLWIFFQQRKFISTYIDEWTPLNANPIGFWIFTGTVIFLLAFTLFIVVKRKKVIESLWLLPLLAFIALAYSASRNAFLGNITLTLMLGWSLGLLTFKTYSKKAQTLIILLIVVVIGANIWLIVQKKHLFQLFYPVKAAQFIKSYDLKGNMFNEYGYGGYLLYQLYPEHKVFFDGRTDVYLCCEMRDTYKMATDKYLPDDQYQKMLYQSVWDKYHISYVLLRTEKHTVIRKISKVLSEDPQWILVFWDDYTQIFARRDGENNSIIEKFGAHYATPYLRDPFQKKDIDKAYREYLRMDEVATSARTSNAIGYIELYKGDFKAAETRFKEAVRLDPEFESPLMNLAELRAKDGDYYNAIELYKKAQKLAIDRGLIYIRLGQLYIEGYNQVDEAKKIWKAGLKQTVDKDAKKELQNLLNNN